MKSANSGRKYRKDTLVAHLGRHPEAQNGAVNPPVYHASTILSANMAEWETKRDPSTRFDVIRYGLLGTPTTFALEEAVAAIEGGYRAMLMSSGPARWPRSAAIVRTGRYISSLVMTAPRITSEWPTMYLVAAWIDTSTPCSNERNR